MSDGPLNRQQIQERLLDSPFNAFLALEVVTADPTKAEVVMRLKMRPQFERLAGTGIWHGGPIAAAIDIVGDYCLAMLFGKTVPTTNLRVDYLRPGRNRTRELFYGHRLSTDSSMCVSKTPFPQKEALEGPSGQPGDHPFH